MASRHLETGTVIAGKYQLVARLGGGGMGEVYRAEHQLAGRTVALKILRPEFADDPNLTRRFFQEAQATNKIRHPNIVDVLDAGFSEQGPYVAMECLEGMSLSAALARVGKLGQTTALSILLPTLDALDAAHRHGIVHRDLKPENVFLVRAERDGPAPQRSSGWEVRVKLLDFGIAKVLDVKEGSSPHTHTGIVFGTPDYLSPEQAAGEGVVDGRSDLFAVGIVLFELLCGRRPFEADSVVATAYRIVHAEAPALESLGVKVEPGLQAALDVALAKRPEDRFATAGAFADALAPMVPDGATRRQLLRDLFERAVSVAPLRAMTSRPPPEPVPSEMDPQAVVLAPTERRALLPAQDMRSALAVSVAMTDLARPKEPPSRPKDAPRSAMAPTMQSASVPTPAGRQPKPPPGLVAPRAWPPAGLPVDRPTPDPQSAPQRLTPEPIAQPSPQQVRPRARLGSQPELPPPSRPMGARASFPGATRELVVRAGPPPTLVGRAGPTTPLARGPAPAPETPAEPQAASRRTWTPRPLPPDVRGKCHVRGSLPRAVSRWIERANGAAGRNRVLASILPSQAELYRSDGFNALVWYDLEALDAFLEAATRVLLEDDQTRWRALARENFDRDLGPIFRPAQKVTEGDALLRRMPANWSRIYDFGTMRFGDAAWGRIHVEIDDFGAASLALRYVTIGTVEGMLRSGGVSGVAVRVRSGEASFAREFGFDVMWVPKG